MVLETISTFFTNILVFSPLPTLILIGFLVSLFVTLVSKFLTDQKALKKIKEDMSELRAKLKTHKSDIKVMGDVNRQMIQRSSEQMRKSIRSLFFTLLPLLLVITWMQGNVALDNIDPGDQFSISVILDEEQTEDVNILLSVEGEATLQENQTALQIIEPATYNSSVPLWILTAEQAGNATLTYTINDAENYTQEILITEQWRYNDPLLEKDKEVLSIRYASGELSPSSPVDTLMINLEPTRPFGEFSLFGWTPGWLVTYILATLVFSLLLRKFLKVY